ncbi:STAS domain-containing protein [Nocardioides caeni]|uniref:Anti-sigma factor antagonist n=1 Tax=Nocardioides caeni TaxID=574700 RepID=A0A4S8NTG3_9ACTN|nr:STAS domain-containing protein [Nocardioides caeni]THV18434.1 STAS domain-containing protein [Nocardioides caeni]
MRERKVQVGRRRDEGSALRAVESTVDIHTDGGVLVLGGDLDVRSTGEVRAAVHQHLRDSGPDAEGRIVVDISRVASVDATALKVIAAASRQARRRGVRVVLRGTCPAVLRMLHLTHLIRLIDVERVPAAV